MPIYIYLDILLCRHTHTTCRYCLSFSVPRCLVCCYLPDVYYRCERHLVSRLVCVTGCYRVSLSMFDVRQYFYLHHSVFPGQLCPTMFVTSPVPQDYSHITTITRLCPRMSSSEKISNSLDFSCILETCLAKIGNCIREHFMEWPSSPAPTTKAASGGKEETQLLGIATDFELPADYF